MSGKIRHDPFINGDTDGDVKLERGVPIIELRPMRFATWTVRDDVSVSSIRLLDIPGGCVAESVSLRITRTGQASSDAFSAGRFCFVTLDYGMEILLA